MNKKRNIIIYGNKISYNSTPNLFFVFFMFNYT